MSRAPDATYLGGVGGGSDGAGSISNVTVGVAGVEVTVNPRNVPLATPEAIAPETPLAAACAPALLPVRIMAVTTVEPATMLESVTLV